MAARHVYLIDDDDDFRQALERMLKAEDMQVHSFNSATAFMQALQDDWFGCLVLDIAMPGFDGLETQERLKQHLGRLPIVFLTGHGDIPLSVRAIKSGAIDFLTKPVKRLDLIRAIQEGHDKSETYRIQFETASKWRNRYQSLTAREKEVFDLVIIGKTNKQIAEKLGTTEQTIKVHRSKISRKLGVKTAYEFMEFRRKFDIDVQKDPG